VKIAVRSALAIVLIGALFLLAASRVLAPQGGVQEAGETREPTGPLSPVTTEVDATGYVKGLYISHTALGSDEFNDHVKKLLETTELNAVVMDFKGDFGYLTFPTEVPLAKEIGADQQVMIKDPAEFLRWFKDRKVYTIARIVVFKDDLLTAAHPELAVTDSATGGVWHDAEKLGWADPSYHAVWDYNIALAIEAAKTGFDEVQFDYVRFPTDGNIGRTAFAMENTQENRTAAIAGFLSRAKDALAPYGAKLGADVFGYTAWVADDLGIGQEIESLAPYVDVISPMVYPSTFSFGLPEEDPKYNNAIAYPYEIVNKSTKRAVDRALAVNPQVQVRPWLQDFGDYAFDWRDYTPWEIRLQIVGARDAGARGWMLWDPAVIYTPEALVSASPSYPPNTSGNVLVLAYHRIAEPEGAGQRTPAAFRADLERLLAGGYYPVNLQDLVEGKLNMVPAGKRPVILTFDGATPDQFTILPDGSVEPNSGVGILSGFHAAHPIDWPLRATFFVPTAGTGGSPDAAPFGTSALAAQKLQTLVAWGAEVGNQVPDGADLSRLSPEEVQQELLAGKAQLQALLPGYEPVSLCVPNGRAPRDVSLLAHGEKDGETYTYKAIVGSANGTVVSPLSTKFDPYRIPRVQATQQQLDKWLTMADRQGIYYVSAGE
jgi:peptidoglycan/xylan/chitin deacetylase (PgdA/CDA1 family)